MHGANLSIAAHMSAFAKDERVGELEVFLPPDRIVLKEELAAAAKSVLPPGRSGKGILSFFPIQAIPERWGDGRERVFWSIDPEWLVRDRYLRDRFAAGSMPIVCDTHAFGYYPMWRILQRIAGASAAPYDTLLALTKPHEAVFRRAFALLGCPETPLRIEVMPHGVDIKAMTPTTSEVKRSARQMLRLPESSKIALYFGRMTPNAKADLIPLLQAFADVSDAESVLVLAGIENAKGYAAVLQRIGAELGLGERLFITGEVTPSFRYLYFAAADLFVFPGDSVQEAMGNTVLEAMACGLPVIASDWDGFKDIVVHGQTGYLVPTRILPCWKRTEDLSPASSFLHDWLHLGQTVLLDPQGLRSALSELLSREDLRLSMGAAGRKRAEELFAWPSIVDRIFGQLDTALEGARGESRESAELRRQRATSIAFPQPYLELFADYATQVIEPASWEVKFTARGSRVAGRLEKLDFYEEVLPLIRPPLLDAIFRRLNGMGGQWLGLDALIGSSALGGASEEDAAQHIAFLAKRGLLDLKPRGN